jgi:cytochrome c oxidase assembly protein subunit 15
MTRGTPNTDPRPSWARSPVLASALVYGLGTSIAVWSAWYITHLPWLGLHEQVSLPIILAVWLLGMIAAGRSTPQTLALGLLSGLIAALAGLMAFGSKLVEPAPQGDAAAGLRPNALLMVLGFLSLGAALGWIGALIGRALAPRQDRPTAPAASPPAPGMPLAIGPWPYRFALVTTASIIPLIVAGGLVTSTDSGMAVPDWPNTYGANMFLYPLGPRARPDVYLEHAHRLLGTLAGLTTLILMIWVVLRVRTPWIRVLAVIAFYLVALQGILGGLRVLRGSGLSEQTPRLLAMTHGIAAQLIFGIIVGLAAALSPLFHTPTTVEPPTNPGPWRRARFFTTGLLHATILQLIFGAMYRHFRDNHSLWTHAGFAMVVMLFALAAGFILSNLVGGPRAIAPLLRRLGIALLIVVCIQFILGWITFGVGGSGRRAAEPWEAILRTAHQANGALLLATAVLCFTWTRRSLRLLNLAGAPPAQPG